MKLKLASLLLSIGIPFMANAQQVHHCASAEYLKSLDQLHPGFEQYVKDLPLQVANYKNTRAENVTIPVVVHIVYKNATENLTDAYVTAQIDLLNKAYQRKNADTVKTRNAFKPIVGPAKIGFILDQIVRKQTSEPYFNYAVDGFGNNSADWVKMTAMGGSDAIAPDKKMNIWVCDLEDNGGPGELLGFAYPPPGLPNWTFSYPSQSLDGVVIDYLAFGGANPKPKAWQTLGMTGKTAVHEVGHYLGLRHTWGDDNGKCSGQPGFQDDGVNDTPHQADETPFNCDTTKNTCSQGAGDLKDMIENYMDYTDESCQNSFTKQQVLLMESVLDNQRLLIRVPVKVDDVDISTNVSVYPNPADAVLNVSLTGLSFNAAVVNLNNTMGQIVSTQTLDKTNSRSALSISGLPKGIYFVSIVVDNKYHYNQKVLIR